MFQKSKSTDKLKLLTRLACKHLHCTLGDGGTGLPQPKTLKLTWVQLGDEYLPNVEIEFQDVPK